MIITEADPLARPALVVVDAVHTLRQQLAGEAGGVGQRRAPRLVAAAVQHKHRIGRGIASKILQDSVKI